MILPKLCAIVDELTSARHGWGVCELARRYLEGGARWLQIRVSGATSGDYLSNCERIIEDAATFGAKVIVNNRLDIAALSGAAGVHIGQSDIPATFVRGLLRPNSILGLSTHTQDEIKDAATAPVDYVAVGPVFQTTTKETGCQATGPQLLGYASEISPVRPLVAIGGITLDRTPEVIAAGATNVAVISDLLRGDPERRVADYISVLDGLEK